MIKLEKVTKIFGSLKAVNKISLEVKSGELYSFLGPNGAGKTTTIKMITGLMTPDTGQISINDYDIAKNPIAAKQVLGYVPDNAFLYNRLSGIEFFHVVGNLYGMSKKDIDKNLKYFSERLGIEKWLTDRIEGYSQGMKQRLVFAATFFHDPEVLVIDEPMVGLDPKSARIIRELLKEQRDKGKTIFLSTHNLNVAEELSDRIAIIHNGNILRTGDMASLKGSFQQDENLEDFFLELLEQQS